MVGVEANDTSCLTTRLVLAYAHEKGGRRAVEAILEAAGCAGQEAELLDEHNWVTYDVKIRLFEAAADVLDDPEVMLHVGERVLDLNAGEGLKIALKALGSPEIVYRNIVRANNKFSRGHQVQFVEGGEGHVRLRFVDLLGHERFHALDCQYNRGLLTSVPEIFGQRPAQVRHLACGVEGAEACEYDVRWDEAGNHVRFGIATGAASAAAVLLSAVAEPAMLPVATVGAIVALSLAANRVRGVWHRRSAQLEAELRDQSLNADRLARSLHDLVSELRFEDVLAKVTANARAAVGGQQFALLLTGESGLRCQSSSGMPDDTVDALERWAAATPSLLAEPRLVDDVSAVKALRPVVGHPTLPLRSLCAAPLIVHGAPLGLLIALSAQPCVFLPRDVEQLRSYAVQAGIAVFNARLYADQRDLASHDGLTGLLNHGAFYDALERAMPGVDRGPAVVLVDLDGFKQVNDRDGHGAGDELLRRVAAALQDAVRPGDRVFRLGGDEFAVLLENSGIDAARGIAYRIQSAVSGLDPRVGASAGIAVHPDDGAEPERLLACADARLYAMKSQRRGGGRASRGGPVDGVIALAEALDLRDKSTASHSRTVARHAELTGAKLGLPRARLERLRLAGLLHDLGKVGIPDAVLHKCGPLTDDEWTLMRTHPDLGARICASAGLDDVAGWVRSHHERPDGRGYPDGIGADEIPLESAILAVADAYEAMTSDRPYRAGMPVEHAREELGRCAGTQFDPVVVDAFLAASAAVAAIPA
jgi:diguanylate cyclase (GGDEF)-like protein